MCEPISCTTVTLHSPLCWEAENYNGRGMVRGLGVGLGLGLVICESKERQLCVEIVCEVKSCFLFHVKAQSHYDAGGAPVLFRGSTGDNRDEPGTTGNNRGSTGKSPGRTGNDRRGMATTRTAPGTTGMAPLLHRGPYRPRQSYGNAPIVAGVAPLRYIGKPALCRYATSIHRGSAWALPATTGVKLGLPVELRYTGALPGRCRLSPGLHLVIAGDNRGFTGINRS
ncbi:hypothetical protein DPMN_170106 [Dreissena polymorpha]|uniref:Uncharacterized protein n=1 Tax=Dreissena polymorpha TaxID=45954 RepID=A0A9D4ICW6_DREPO|nr:hypothetical protein DPMN_170106 [Dreissena polymorpha]